MMKSANQFTGKENHSITKAEAISFIKSYKEHFGAEAESGCFFGSRAVQAILDQPGAVGMRYYYGTDDFGQQRLVLVGTKADRSDLLQGEPLKKSIPNPPVTTIGLYDPAAANHRVTTEEAAELTARYRENLLPGQPKGGFFGKQAIQKLIDHSGCTGLRFSFGAKKDGVRVIVILCVDKHGAEMFDGPMAELSMFCPPICWPNILNSDYELSRSEFGKTVLRDTDEMV